MATYTASRELLAPREDVWAFLAEPNRLADWWPGVRGVQPDRRGFAPGARWGVQTQPRTNIFVGGKLDVTGTLILLEVERPERVAWQFVHGHVDVELHLEASAAERTIVDLTVSAPFMTGLSRTLPRRALTRLYALCQTGAQA